jgi:hypothetical protein
MKYRGRCKTEWSSGISVGKNLVQESIINDEIEMHTTELEHRNRLLKMENDIMGERLKGLFESITSMSSNEGIEAPFRNELVGVKESGKRLKVNRRSLATSLGDTMRNSEKALAYVLTDS